VPWHRFESGGKPPHSISPAVVKFLHGEFPDDRDLIAMEGK
jgi:hypothetical protein